MDIDMSILRMLEREKEISFDVLVEAIEQALLTAYHKSPGAQDQARVVTPRQAAEAGARYVVVGRMVTGAADRLAAMEAVARELA